MELKGTHYGWRWADRTDRTDRLARMADWTDWSHGRDRTADARDDQVSEANRLPKKWDVEQEVNTFANISAFAGSAERRPTEVELSERCKVGHYIPDCTDINSVWHKPCESCESKCESGICAIVQTLIGVCDQCDHWPLNCPWIQSNWFHIKRLKAFQWVGKVKEKRQLLQ